MVDKIDAAEVFLWGTAVGAVLWRSDLSYAVFEYHSDFLKLGLDPSPIHMSLQDSLRGNRVYSFPGLKWKSFYGLPGLLADALPDKFGNAIINQWLARTGRDVASFSPVERLCYMGTRGMGALEFKPSLAKKRDEAVSVEVEALVNLAQEIMKQRENLNVPMGNTDEEAAAALADIFRVGTSAGGARPKAVVAVNDETNSIKSGQSTAPPGYKHWILKFDGVEDIELGPSKGYGRIEYAYYRIATACGIDMTPCRLLEENGRAHFMTQRFDRDGNDKIHMQSLCGLAHYDFNLAGAYGYEQAFKVMRKLRLPYSDAEQMYRRMVFNVISRNQDDHTKNIAFLMDKDGSWRLSPAYDVTYAYRPNGPWTNQHQMSINGKRRGITRDDLLFVGRQFTIKRPGEIIDQVVDEVATWPRVAREEEVASSLIEKIKSNHLLFLKD